MQDLGTIPGDVASVGLGINDGGDIVGISNDPDFNLRAFVRQNGVMSDLNTLIPSDSPLFLIIACSINASGEIIGIAVDKNTGDAHGYLATPRKSNSGAVSVSPPWILQTARTVLSEPVRTVLQLRLRSGRFGPR